MEKKNKLRRLEWIDLVKGIAIGLVVIGHMLRGFVSSGMYSEYKNIFIYIDYTIYSFHMTLFFIISGALFKNSKKLENMNQYFLFIKKKVILLAIPYFVFSWIQIVIKLIMSNSVNNKVNIMDFFTIIFNPIEQFWFLYSLMIIFIIMGFIDIKIKSEQIKFIIIILSFLLANYTIIDLGILGNAISNIIYFYIGEKIIENKERIKINNNIIISLLALYIILNLAIYNFKFSQNILIISRFIMAVVASLTIITICKKFQYNDKNIIYVFKILGKHSMAIYLLHIILGSGIRIVLLKLSINSLIVQVILGLIFAIIIPILLENIYVYLVKRYAKVKRIYY